ncbi:MAG: D-2-hydroxyacid dehydrogenase [Planctomyces sp.]|nr:D-2-hydroxyacid dehydrogenase [Planctomyces sp.]
MSRKLVIHPPLDDFRWEQVQAAAGPAQVVNAHSQDEALREIRDAQGFFGKLTPDLLAAAPQLEWVQSPTASLEHFLFPELVAHPCRLSNMRGLFSDVIAEHVLGMMLCFTRNLHTYVRQQQAGHWSPVGGEETRASFTTGPGEISELDRRHRSLADCSLGVVGVGSIGAEICRRGAAFGMPILGVDPVVRQVRGVLEAVWPVERLPELLEASDFVVVAAPHTPETERWFRRPHYQRMRRSAVLINIGRGAIVPLDELTAALDEGLIAGAGLDVFETEPLPPEHPLWRNPNVILTPHVAGMSRRIPQRHLETLLENVRRFAVGQDPVNLVDKSRWF